MRNIAEFPIIGRVSRTEVQEKVAYIDLAANYDRKVNGQRGGFCRLVLVR